MLTQKRLKALLHYDPASGLFTRAVTTSSRAIEGALCGHVNGSGYVYIMVDRRSHKAHRLAFLWMTGAWPSDEVDHRNGVKADNRWENLRGATRAQNEGNKGLRSTNSSGFKGVSRGNGATAHQWKAYVRVAGRITHLGYFDTAAEAGAVAAAKRVELYGEFAHD